MISLSLLENGNYHTMTTENHFNNESRVVHQPTNSGSLLDSAKHEDVKM